MPPFLLAALVAATLALPAGAHAQEPSRDIALDARTELVFGFDRATGDERAAILRDGVEVWSAVDARLRLDPEVPPGTDIDGDGRPDLLIHGWSGGANCCHTWYILSLESEFRVVAALETGGASVVFADLDGRPGLELATLDTSFGYLYSPHGGAPAPPLVLGWQDGMMVAATGLMAAPPPDIALDDIAAEIAVSDLWSPYSVDPRLWPVVLDLAYTGHLESASRFLDAAWPDGRDGRDDFQTTVLCHLAAARWGPAVLAMNGHEAPPDCPTVP